MFYPYRHMFEAQIDEIRRQMYTNKGWFSRRGINVLDKKSSWMFSKDEKAEANHWNMICNGLMINKVGKILSCPPCKIYPVKDTCINLNNCDIIQKVGGSMVCLFWPNGWSGGEFVHTIDSSQTDPDDFTSTSILNEFCMALKGLNLSHSRTDRYFTMTFKYDNEQIYLVAGRSLHNFNEHTENELDSLAKTIGVKRPLRFNCPNGWETIISVLKDYDHQFIVRDCGTGERGDIALNVKKSLSTYDDLIRYWCNGTYKRIKIEQPETALKFNHIDAAAKRIVIDVHKTAYAWKCLNLSARTLIHSVCISNAPPWSHRIIMALQKIEELDWDKEIERRLKILPVPTLLNALGLKDQ